MKNTAIAYTVALALSIGVGIFAFYKYVEQPRRIAEYNAKVIKDSCGGYIGDFWYNKNTKKYVLHMGVGREEETFPFTPHKLEDKYWGDYTQIMHMTVMIDTIQEANLDHAFTFTDTCEAKFFYKLWQRLKRENSIEWQRYERDKAIKDSLDKDYRPILSKIVVTKDSVYGVRKSDGNHVDITISGNNNTVTSQQ